jgi:FKBP-type peptidyl-prolyl cis-trans isomerase 2
MAIQRQEDHHNRGEVVNKQTRQASKIQIATIDWRLQPLDGFVPEPLFDSTGIVQFVLGGSSFLPALHDLVRGMAVGAKVEDALIDAGWGNRRDDLIITLPLAQLEKAMQKTDARATVEDIEVGKRVAISETLSVLILSLTDNTVTVDANSPLAGACYSCSLTLLALEEIDLEVLQSGGSPESDYEVASFALGCFWGAELAMTRTYGVVGTQRIQPTSKSVKGTHTIARLFMSSTTRSKHRMHTCCRLQLIAYE